MIFKFDLKRSLKTSVIFTAIMFIILVLGLIAYKCAFYKQDNFLSFINNLPSFVIKGLGIKTDGNYSFYDFYAILVNFILIIAALFASFIGFFCILKDKKDDADAFYFKKPINKVSIIKQKILACFVLLLASTLIYHIVAFIFIIIIKEKYNFKIMFYIDSSIFLLELVFLLFGTLIGLFINKKRSFIAPSIITIFIFEFINILSQAFNITFLKYINPFSYFNVLDIVKTQKYQYRFIVITTFLVLFLSNFTIGVYNSEEE